jgi:hypothetical protein
MSSVGFDEGEVLWIDPAVHDVPELPGGFAFLVQGLLGWGDPGRTVWVRGALIDGRGTPLRSLTLCVPTNQSRAVPATRVPRHAAPANAGDIPAGNSAHHRTDDDLGLVGPPPGYARRV